MPCHEETRPDKTAALEICEAMGPVTSDSLIPILQQIQDAYGYLPAEVLMEVSATYTGIAEKITGQPVPLSDNPRAEIIAVVVLIDCVP